MEITDKLVRRIRNICRQHMSQIQGRHKHFSFACRRSSIVAIGYAKAEKTHPGLKWFSYQGHSGIHSEFDVMRKLNFHGEGLYIVNVRMNKRGRFMLSKPCPCCTRMLIDRGISTVFYSDYDQHFHRLEF